MRKFSIAGQAVGVDHPPYIIAEVSANHGGDLQLALDTITKARDIGADAVKIQTYTPDTMTLDSDRDDFKISGGPWDGYRLYDLYREAHTPYQWHSRLFEHARNLGITLFSSPFDETAVELLEGLGSPAYKIASFEVTDLPLLQRVGETGKPVVMSTGMANETEIDEALSTLVAAGCEQVCVLHCISGYPTPPEQAHLRALTTLARRWPEVTLGLSDHSLSNEVVVAAVALGASLIEKHFTLDRSKPSPDNAFSLEPDEFQQMIHSSHTAWRALGEGGFSVKSAENANLRFRRSLYVCRDIAAGELLTEQNVRRVRPGYGLAPKEYKTVLGRRARVALPAGTPLSWDHFSDIP